MAPKPPRTVDLDRWATYTRGALPQSLSVGAADLEREGAVTLVDVGCGRTVWIAAGNVPRRKPTIGAQSDTSESSSAHAVR
jgi:hypothetical protein